MEEYFCMECKHFGYDIFGRGTCNKDEDSPCSVGAYQVHTEMECFRKKGE